jgi:hypothetical protein
MDTDLKAEVLAQVARLDELIDKSTEIIEKTVALLDQSRRLVRQAKRHDVDEGRLYRLDTGHLRR